MRAAAAGVDRYPDPECKALRTAIAKRYGLRPERLVCGAGSEALIHVLMRCYLGPGDALLTPAHAFSLGKIAAMSCGAAVDQAADASDLGMNVDSILSELRAATKAVYLPNPNNPTGAMLSVNDVARLRRALPDRVLLILDAAYRDYVCDPVYDPGDALVGDEEGNVAVLSTFSKSYGLAGARVGWLHASQDIVDVVNRVRPAFGVNAMAQAAACAAINDRPHVEAEIALVSTERKLLFQRLEGLGLTVTPSHGNFVLVHLPRSLGGAAAANAFLIRHGILVRPVASYRLPDALRITVGQPAQNSDVVASLAEWLSMARDSASAAKA